MRALRRDKTGTGGRARRRFVAVLSAAFLGASMAVTSVPPAAAGATGATPRGGWTLQRVSGPTGTAPDDLASVSCVTATWCQAVGVAGPAANVVTAAELWNGRAWSLETTPNVAGAKYNYLSGVACASVYQCVAVGYHSVAPGYTETLAETFNGKAWAVASMPVPQGADYSYLNAVACTKAFQCMAVGYASTPKGYNFAITERWDGTMWALLSTPVPTGARASSFGGVSCVSATVCVAAGQARRSSTSTLIERWNGSSWAMVASPNVPGATDSLLRDVACTGSTACEAVGNSVSATGSSTLAERWNGGAWRILSSPDPASEENSFLESVSCTSPASCIAVGDANDGGTTGAPLVEVLAGARWTIEATPTPPGATYTDLRWVVCSVATSCEAVGSYENRAEAPFPLAEHGPG